MELSQEDIGAGREAFKNVTGGGIQRTYIPNGLFFSEDYDQYKQDGHVKIHRAEHQIKAASGFVESIGPNKKTRSSSVV